MSSPADPVTIVVPNHQGARFLGGTLDAVHRQTRPPARVVVVDNASTDGSVELARDLGVEVRQLSANLGYGAAANEGLRACRTPNLAVLNSDARPEPTWLEQLADRGTQRDDIWAWGSVLIRSSDDLIESAGDFVRPSGRSGKHLGGRPLSELPDQPYEVLAPPGAAPLLRADIVRELGGWFEPFFLYYEDLDLALRARLAGYRCHLVPSARVVHDLAGSSGGRPPWRYIARSSTWCAIRSNPSASVGGLLRLHAKEFGIARRQGAGVDWAKGKVDAIPGIAARLRERRAIMAAAIDTAWIPGPPASGPAGDP